MLTRFLLTTILCDAISLFLFAIELIQQISLPRKKIWYSKSRSDIANLVLIHFSSRQWKGGGIDGRACPRTGSSEWIVLTHSVGTRHGCSWCVNPLLLFCWVWPLAGGRILWWRQSHSGWDVSRSLCPCDGERAWDACSWRHQHTVTSWFWVWILLQRSTYMQMFV